MASDHQGKLSAAVQAAEQGGGFVWVIVLADFTAGQIKRTLVSEDNFATAAAAKVAGEARLKEMSEDR